MRNPTLKEIRDELDEYIKKYGDKELASVGTYSGSGKYAFTFSLCEVNDRYLREVDRIELEKR